VRGIVVSGGEYAVEVAVDDDGGDVDALLSDSVRLDLLANDVRAPSPT
jgi:hypothetical protein